MISMKEMDIYGVFIPPVLMWGIVAIMAVKVVHKQLAKRNFYRSDAEQQCFDIALFVIFTSVLCFGIS